MINWISTKEVAKLPDTTRSVLVLVEGNDKVLTAKFFPEWGWKLETCYRDDGYPKQTNIMFWADYNLPK